MIYLIPGEVLSLLTLPGVILHEIAHRFFCDLFNIPVYAVHYFRPLARVAGCVVHHPTESVVQQFFIGMGPLIINSLVCIALTFPRGTASYLHTDFVQSESFIMHYAQWIMVWMGYSCGLNAIPSNQDVNGLADASESVVGWAFLSIIEALVYVANIPILCWFIRIAYTYSLSLVLPLLLLENHAAYVDLNIVGHMFQGIFSFLLSR